MERVWEYTQTPHIHQEWDLRFNSIEYLPKEQEDDPQHFLYATKIGVGLKVSGKGKSVGTHSKETGESTSALKFWSDEKISLIRTGSGYWKYIPATGGVTFLTWYDYETRWGIVGKIIDKLMFRPLIWWATAWSFDALKLWLEKGIPARQSKNLFYVYCVANFLIALTWIYHGVVPKLMYMETGELAMIQTAGISTFKDIEPQMVYAVGIGEILFGLCFLLFGRQRIIHYLSIFGLIGLGIGALISKPDIYTYPFNPATTSFGIIGLSLIVLKIVKYVPSASNCKYKPDNK